MLHRWINDIAFSLYQYIVLLTLSSIAILKLRLNLVADLQVDENCRCMSTFLFCDYFTFSIFEMPYLTLADICRYYVIHWDVVRVLYPAIVMYIIFERRSIFRGEFRWDPAVYRGPNILRGAYHCGKHKQYHHGVHVV